MHYMTIMHSTHSRNHKYGKLVW